PPLLVGASMGGLLALGVAGERQASSPCRALVLVDSTPRMRAPGIERILGFMRAAPEGFANHDEALAAIARFQPQRHAQRNELAISTMLRARDDGRLTWHWDPAMLEAVTATGANQESRLLAAASAVRVPTLLVSGGRSDVVSAATVAEFLRLLPHAQHVELADASHSVVGDAGPAFVRILREFCTSIITPDTALCSSTVA
ncbi:MAG: alpha/beta hydrolase, partial [Xanthomonadales bacterium]|nr:alpha/beta hydrolase [Xanthomonadales bacterium]